MTTRQKNNRLRLVLEEGLIRRVQRLPTSDQTILVASLRRFLRSRLLTLAPEPVRRTWLERTETGWEEIKQC